MIMDFSLCMRRALHIHDFVVFLLNNFSRFAEIRNSYLNGEWISSHDLLFLYLSNSIQSIIHKYCKEKQVTLSLSLSYTHTVTVTHSLVRSFMSVVQAKKRKNALHNIFFVSYFSRQMFSHRRPLYITCLVYHLFRPKHPPLHFLNEQIFSTQLMYEIINAKCITTQCREMKRNEAREDEKEIHKSISFIKV